jgi:hypothetical protein
MQSWLPSGWTYYAKLNEFQLGETQDFWSLEHGFLVRHYVLGPSSTFTFDRETLQGMPVPVSSLQKYKISQHGQTTVEIYLSRSHQHQL